MAQSYGKQFTEIVDNVIELNEAEENNYDGHWAKWASVILGDIEFLRGNMPADNLHHEHLPKLHMVILPLGKLSVSATRPDEIVRERLFIPKAEYAISRQMNETFTSRTLEDDESDRVIGWLKSPFITPPINEIILKLSPEEREEIEKAQEKATADDQHFNSQSRNSRRARLYDPMPGRGRLI